MYTVAVTRNFIAQHFLFGGDWGAENELHSHHYKVELQCHGHQLDQHGYLVDIVFIERNLEKVVSYFQDQTLNNLPEFAGLNPSVEHFSRIICQKLLQEFASDPTDSLTVVLWENDIAWASYTQNSK